MDKRDNEKLPIKIDVDGSLGLLALGDIAFVAWRKLKQAKNSSDQNRKKDKNEE